LKIKDWLAFILLGLAWGSSFLWIKIAVQEVDPFTLVAFRLLFGILGLLAVVAINRPAWPKDRRLWLALALLGLTNTAIPFVLISWGELYIDSAVAALFYASSPVFARRNAGGISTTVQSLVPLLVADAAIWLVAPVVEAPFSVPPTHPSFHPS
jgi:hypothetical protein